MAQLQRRVSFAEGTENDEKGPAYHRVGRRADSWHAGDMAELPKPREYAVLPKHEKLAQDAAMMARAMQQSVRRGTPTTTPHLTPNVRKDTSPSKPSAESADSPVDWFANLLNLGSPSTALTPQNKEEYVIY
jgi:cbb3-type cytochrome oxidase cytochrome c subunit